MGTVQAILYIIAVGLITVAAFGVRTRVSLALLGAASLALGYTLPVIAAI